VDSKTLSKLRDVIDRHEVFVQVTHVNPDGDGLGSAMAMSRWLRSQGKEARVVLPSAPSKRLAFLASPGELDVLDGAPPRLPAGTVFMLHDVSTLRRLGIMEPIVRKSTEPIVVFDHHDGAIELDGLAVVDADAGATAQVVYDVLTAWNAPMALDIALPLYVGLLADTGSFNYGKTSPHTHEVAARLLAAGVDPLWVHGQLEGRKSAEGMRIAGEVLRHLRVDDEDPRIAWLMLPMDLWKREGDSILEAVDLVNQTIAVDGVEAGALLIHAERGRTRLSMRSKGKTSVLETAKAFGGGGHVNAAGASIDEEPDALLPKLLARLRADLRAQLGPPTGPSA
jgi:phosphoesterase RecJ-like protein